MTLTEFLSARLDEWEGTARAASEHRTNTSAYSGTDAYLTHGQRAGMAWRPTYDEVHSDWDNGMRGKIAAVGNFGGDLTTHIALNDPAFVLAQVSTYRTIMALHRPDDPRDSRCVTCFFETEDDMPEGWVTSHVPDYWPCDTLRALAHPWINHPDYRTEWA